MDLGTYWCAEGRDGCRVILDGNDDDYSDEANAVRFRLVGADDTPPPSGTEPPPTPEPPAICDLFPGLGDHQQRAWATTVRGPDFTDKSRATGKRDGRGAHSPNLDSGEFLRAAGWTICDPPGEEVITSVRLSVRARTQYQSGRYDVLVRLDARGDAETLWHDTTYGWYTVDVTSDRSSWTWEDVAALRGELTLHSHPGGRRDSDIWVDAWRLRVGFTSTEAPSSGARDDEGGADDEPEECPGGCTEDSDWWADDTADGANDDGDFDDDWDDLDGAAAEDDAPAVVEEDAEEDEPTDDEQDGNNEDGSGTFGAADMGAPGYSDGSGEGCASATGLQTATLLPVVPFVLLGLGLRRRRDSGLS